jgi:dihydrolipoamide dehydrogenase
MIPKRVDAIIIGSGQGGVPLAEALAKRGKDVVIFERGLWGGCCLNYGCTPSKMLLASAHAASDARNAAELGINAQVEIDFPAVMARIRETTTSWSDGVTKRLEKAGVTTVHKEAYFISEHKIGAENETFEADTIVINTGKSPAIPPIDGLKNTPFLTYESIWQLEDLPHKMIIVGGGYVGVELGQAFARLGSEVFIIEANERIIHQETSDISQVLQEQMKKDGVIFHFNQRAQKVHYENKIFRVDLDGGGALKADCLLLAVGRKPNTRRLQPSQGNIKLDDKGHVVVNDQLLTSTPGVYAIGDVTGQPAFTHVSWEDYRRLIGILDGKNRSKMDRVLGYAFFTYPQVGRVGYDLEQAKASGFDTGSVDLPLENVARASETGNKLGFYRMVIDQKTDTIIGATLVSPTAAELIHVFISLIEAGSTWQMLEESVFIHPTFAEGLPSLARKFKE